MWHENRHTGCGRSLAHPQKVDIEQIAHDISHATTAEPTDVELNDYVSYGEMERVHRVNGCLRPTKGYFGR